MRALPASEPEEGSVNPQAPMNSPVASLETYFFFCALVARHKNVVRAERSVGGDDDADRSVDTREFFDGGDVFDVAHAGAAVFGRKDRAHQAEFA